MSRRVKTAGGIRRALRSNARRVANAGIAELRAKCPVRTGKMKRSISRQQSGNTYNMAARVRYAPYVVRYHQAVTRGVGKMRQRIRSRRNDLIIVAPRSDYGGRFRPHRVSGSRTMRASKQGTLMLLEFSDALPVSILRGLTRQVAIFDRSQRQLERYFRKIRRRVFVL